MLLHSEFFIFNSELDGERISLRHLARYSISACYFYVQILALALAQDPGFGQ